jgi:hypothetical protein
MTVRIQQMGGGGGGFRVLNNPYVAGDFSGSGGLTWTVDAGDVNGFTYALSGKLLHVEFDLITTTVGGTLANTFLQVKIPGGFLPSRTCQVNCLCQDNSANWEQAYCIITQASNQLLFRRIAGNWTASANNTRLDFNQSFFVS